MSNDCCYDLIFSTYTLLLLCQSNRLDLSQRMNENNSCPSPPFPQITPGNPYSTLVFVSLIGYPIFLVLVVGVFYVNRQKNVYFSKRPMDMLIASALSTLPAYFSTVIFDFVGSDRFNCGLLLFLSYITNLCVSFPLFVKVARYENKVAILRLTRELQHVKLNSQEANALSVFGKQPLKGEFSLRTLIGHARYSLCRSRTRNDRILNAKFMQTTGFYFVWVSLTGFLYLVVFFIRLGMNPQWIYCTGCEVPFIDTLILIVLTTFNLSLIFLFNPNFLCLKRHPKDGLRIIEECLITWNVGGWIYDLGWILHLTDPNQLYSKGIFNWRYLLLCSGVPFLLVQLMYPFYLSMKKVNLLFSTDVNEEERLSEILSDKELLYQLQKFLERELSPEILDFFLIVQKFKKEPTQELGRDIFKTFIAANSPKEINLSFRTRKRAEEAMLESNSKFEVNSFDETYNEVKAHFLRDGFPRFLKQIEKLEDQKRSTRSTLYSRRSKRNVESAVISVETEANE